MDEYEPPELAKYGRAEELTKGTGGGSSDLGGLGS